MINRICLRNGKVNAPPLSLTLLRSRHLDLSDEPTQRAIEKIDRELGYIAHMHVDCDCNLSAFSNP